MKKIRIIGLLIIGIGLGTVVLAAPAKPKSVPVQWEYVLVTPEAYRYTGGTAVPAVEVLYPNHSPVYFEKPKSADTRLVVVNVFNRLGTQGWEMVTTPVYNTTGYFVFKRRK